MRIRKDTKDPVLFVRISPEMIKKVKVLAKAQRKSMSKYLEEILGEYFARKKK